MSGTVHRDKIRQRSRKPTIRTPAELARVLDVGKSTVSRWMRRDDWGFSFPVDAGAVSEWRKHGRHGGTEHADELAAIDLDIRRLKREEIVLRNAKLNAETAGLLQRNAIKTDGSVPSSVHKDVILKLADLVVNAVHDLVEPLPALLSGESPDRMRATIKTRFDAFLQRMAAVKTVPPTPIADGNGHDGRRLEQPAAKRAAAKRHKTRRPKE